MRRRGFTLIELLVVIAIIAILAAILFPVFMSAKESARAAKCVGNMKQINSGLLMYIDDNAGHFPDATPGATKLERNSHKECMYHSRVFSMSQSGNQAPPGPFMQDMLRKYVPNKAVWLCPSISANAKWPDWKLHNIVQVKYSQYTWNQNCGTSEWGKDCPTNYFWIHFFFDPTDPSVPHRRVSGETVSIVARPTEAFTFMECPYYEGADPPHKIGECAVNVCYFDGHVKATRATMQAYVELAQKGYVRGIPRSTEW